MTTGQIIKKRRKELGLTAEQLADRLGKDRATIYRYESDAIKDMPSSVLIDIAAALNFSPADLIPSAKDDIVLSADEQRLIQIYRALNDTGKAKAAEYLSDLSDNEKYLKNGKLLEA